MKSFYPVYVCTKKLFFPTTWRHCDWASWRVTFLPHDRVITICKCNPMSTLNWFYEASLSTKCSCFHINVPSTELWSFGQSLLYIFSPFHMYLKWDLLEPFEYSALNVAMTKATQLVETTPHCTVPSLCNYINSGINRIYWDIVDVTLPWQVHTQRKSQSGFQIRDKFAVITLSTIIDNSS